MKVLFVCLCSAFFAGFYDNVYAQLKPSVIEGKVLTDTHIPAQAATVILLTSRDSSISNSTITSKDGVFKFIGLSPGSYLLLVKVVGFKTAYSRSYTAIEDQTIHTSDIILSPDTKQLKEVSVVSSKPQIEVKPGRVILNVQNDLLAQGISAFDILKQSVGVRVDNDNNFSIIGRQSALITIDGKPTNLSGEDLLGVLKGIQSNTIDYIELITSGSAKYEASGGGIINIVLKKGKNNGLNATLTGTLGYGKYYKSNAGIIFNDRSDKFNVFGNYTYSHDKTFHDFTEYRSSEYNNVTTDYDVSYNGIQKSDNNNFGFGTDYFISPGQTVGFLINGMVRTDNFSKNNNLNILNNGSLDSTITANSDLDRHVTRLNYNINYSGKLDKKGTTLLADLNYTTYDRASAEYITNRFYDASGNTYRPDSMLQNLSPSHIRIWLSKIDFSDPLSKNSKLEGGIKFSDVTSNNDLIFGPLVNGQYQSDPKFTNHFVYTEKVNAAYVNFESKFNKFDLTTGLRAEQTIATGNSITAGQQVNSNYLNFFPQVLFSYAVDDNHDFSLSYNRGIQRPLYEEINPFLYYVDLYDYRSGNPNLKPEYTNLIELSYNYKKTFVTTLYSNIITDAYTFDYYHQIDSSGVSIKTQKNFGTIYNYGISFFAPVTFANWWNADFNLDASYQRYVAYPENGNLNQGVQDIIFITTQRFIISKAMTAELSGRYESPTFYGITRYKANYSVNAGIGTQLFNKRASLKLNVSDIFNTLHDRGSINYQNLNMVLTDKVESQIARLIFSWYFGKTRAKTTSHHTGNEDEQKRTGPVGTN
ncbi:MAG TPA: outer membrane beta-barrel family protein [Mucilaginibacter sp.]|jgi:outer membrane receptor protein involved in Fe transport